MAHCIAQDPGKMGVEFYSIVRVGVWKISSQHHWMIIFYLYEVLFYYFLLSVICNHILWDSLLCLEVCTLQLYYNNFEKKLYSNPHCNIFTFIKNCKTIVAVSVVCLDLANMDNSLERFAVFLTFELRTTCMWILLRNAVPMYSFFKQ